MFSLVFFDLFVLFFVTCVFCLFVFFDVVLFLCVSNVFFLRCLFSSENEHLRFGDG